MNILSHPRAPEAAALAAPLLLVALFRLLSPSSAPAAALAQEPAPSINPAALADAVHPKAKAAAAFARETLLQPLGKSPFTTVSAATPTPQTAPAEEETPLASYEPSEAAFAIEPPQLALTSIVASSTGAVVVLNGRLYRLHDSPTPEWAITHIDTARRTVTLTHDSGQARTLALHVPLTPQP